ncbi:FIST N-terminal domain-containing protein [Arcobacter defluvii]|uniref:histidine kinase n=1 Tax=Arcobacter defluvii TaxID=873191 RepID=A0AAE7BEZ8_9BACT|nr:FIST N-terminal domain-containing protein [Arcobacter defluvii]QKF76574.1 FIST sensor-containing two-component system histidine kinase [Arcobacter defluvii]
MKTYNYTLNDSSLEMLIDFPSFKNKKNLLIQIFCGNKKHYLENIVKIITKNLPQAICIGSSTDGEINEENITTLNTVISISVFEKTTLKAIYVKNENSFINGVEIAKELFSEKTKLLITFTDGKKTNGEEFLKGINSINNKIIVCGGMAGDNANFNQTFISYQDKVFTYGCVGVVLDSDVLQVRNSYNFNWSEIGIVHTIDEVDKNRVYKISGLTPLDFYKKYLGSYVASSLPATGIEFPLIVQKNNLPLARAVISKHIDGSLSFAGNLEKGDIVKLGFGNIELIMNNPIESLFKDQPLENIESIFIYSCMARRRYMPNMIDIEIKPFSQIAPTCGFFTYGEFFHYQENNQLLNQSLTLVALSENCSKKNSKKQIKISQTPLSEHARSLEALTHLIQQSSNDYNKQSKKLEEGNIYSQNLITAQKRFLKHAVHETNTPLSVIMGNIEMFEMEFGKNKYLSNIEVAMKNIFSIYDDLSYLIKKDQVNSAIHKINIVDFVRSRIDFFTSSALKFKSNFKFQALKDEININFNEIKLQRIVDNNLTNAIKYTLPNETIFVKLSIFNKECNFTIESNSKQILNPQEIFEEYYREQVSQEGFGLGLNLVKRICNEENVGIKLESGKDWASFTYTFKGVL